MDFQEFKQKYQKKEVAEYPNNLAEKNPLVTVRLVVYNHAPFVRQCLDSVLKQKTSFDFELLIAEDESDDGSREICIEYAEKYPDKIRLLLNSRENNILLDDKPTGVFNAFYANFFIQSKYIAPLEADDYWTDDYSLQKRVDYLETHDDFVMTFHNYTVVNHETGEEDNRLQMSFDESCTIERHDMINTPIKITSMVYRNGLIDKFDDDMKALVCGDVILRAKLGKHGKARYLHDVRPCVYRLHKNSLFSSKAMRYRIKNSVLAREYLIRHFQYDKDFSEALMSHMVHQYLLYFFRIFKWEKKLIWEYWRRSRGYARQLGLSMPRFLKIGYSVLRK